MSFLKQHIKAVLVASDLLSLGIAFSVAIYLKFDAFVYLPEWFLDNGLFILLVDFAVTALCFIKFKIYKRMWQYLIATDYANLITAFGISRVAVVLPFDLFKRCLTNT